MQEALHEAINHSDRSQILVILDIDLELLDNGNAVLERVLQKEHLPEETVIQIFKIFLTPNAENARLEEALRLAVARRMKDVIDLLIEHDAIINGNLFIAHYFVHCEYEQFWLKANDSERKTMEVESADFVEWLISRGLDFHRLVEPEEAGAAEDSCYTEKDESSALNLAEKMCLLHIMLPILKHTKGIYRLEYNGRDLFINSGFRFDSRTLENISGLSDSWIEGYNQRHVPPIVQMILDAGETNLQDRAVLLGFALNDEELSVIEMLTSHFPEGCDERSLASTMFYLMTNYLRSFLQPGWLKILNDLLARGADVNFRGKCGRRALFLAAEAKNVEVVELLIARGADPKLTDDFGQTPLHELAGEDQSTNDFQDEAAAVLDVLVRAGCPVNTRDDGGHTPLDIAVEAKNWMVVWKLGCHGVDIEHLKGIEGCKEFLREIETLKTTFLNDRVSLYDFLYMHPNRKYVYATNEVLGSIVMTPTIEQQFREYQDRILRSWYSALKRKARVERGKEAWIELTEVSMTDDCVERIFVYLSDEDLEAVIKTNGGDSSCEQFINKLAYRQMYFVNKNR